MIWSGGALIHKEKMEGVVVSFYTSGMEAGVSLGGSRCRVLAVDDEDMVRNMISRFLGRLGFEVSTCSNAAEALDCLNSDTFDVLLLDVRMPEVNGLELFFAIKEKWPDMARRTGFVTGNVPSEEVQPLLEKTRRPVLLKPFDLKQIESFVRDLAQEK